MMMKSESRHLSLSWSKGRLVSGPHLCCHRRNTLMGGGASSPRPVPEQVWAVVQAVQVAAQRLQAPQQGTGFRASE